MRRIGRAVWAVAAVVVLAVAAAALDGAVATAQPSAAASNSVSYQDAVGENPAAPDIDTVGVSNDDSGVVSFSVRFGNRTALAPGDRVDIELDTLSFPARFWAVRPEYRIRYELGSASLWRWDAAQLVYVPMPGSGVTASWRAATLRVSTDLLGLGATTQFHFRVVATATIQGLGAADRAPEAWVWWSYTVKLAPVLRVATIGCTPEPAVRGKSLVGTALVKFTQGGRTEALPNSAAITWAATFGDRTIRPMRTVRSNLIDANGQIVSGTWTQSFWRLPKAVKAKTLRVRLTITVEDLTLTKTHVHRVR